MVTYKIVRHYARDGKRVVKRGLTLEQAQAHCRNPETSSRTCTLARNVRRTRTRGPWFDGWTEDN